MVIHDFFSVYLTCFAYIIYDGGYMVVINLLKKQFVFTTLIFLSSFGVSLSAAYVQAQSIDLSGAIEDVCLNVCLANGLQQPNATQTLAYLGHPGLHSEVSKIFSPKISEMGLDFFKSLLKSVIQNEIKFKNDYYVFYHGQPRDFALMQDIYHGLYAIVYKKEMHDFVMLRIPSGDQVKFTTMLDFLTCYIKNDEIFKVHEFDLQPHIKKLLLSVNPSLFGNISFCPGCSTLEYFLFSTGCTFVDTSELMERTFEFFGMQNVFHENQSEIKELQELLCAQEDGKTGLLQQIFVPRKIVDSIAYRAVPFGGLYYEDRNPYRHPVSIDLNYYESGKISDDFLFDTAQFRLLMSGAMLDPESGVKIFTFCNETQKFNDYKIKLRKLLDKVASLQLH
jgi:hypothetical protein